MTDIPYAKKSLGQHWLQDADSLQAMVASADVQPGDTVLEIGPGYGSLTRYLLAAGANVIALEYDGSLIPGLLGQFTGGTTKIHIEQGDIRTFDFTTLPPNYKIVANIPYYLTSNLIQLISETSNPPLEAVLLMQKEVAQRVVTKPGDMSLLSVTAQFYWQATAGLIIKAELFLPPPKVDSQILMLQRRPEPLFPNIDARAFFRLVKAGYSQKRKTLANSLSGGLALPREQVMALLQAAAIDPGRRAQTVSLEEWFRLFCALR